MIKVLSSEDLEKIADAALRAFLLERIKQVFSSLHWSTDKECYLVVVEADDDIQQDYLFIGQRGLISDVFDTANVGDEEFVSPFEVVTHHVELQLYEAYLQCNDAMGVMVFIPESVLLKQAALMQF